MAHDDLAQVYGGNGSNTARKRPPSQLELEKKRAMFLEGYIRFAKYSPNLK